MRTKSEAVKQMIVEFVNEFFDREYRTPSLMEIGNGVGISNAGALRYLREMDEEGTLTYTGRTILTDHIRDLTTQHYEALPVSGEIPCGDPESREEQSDVYVEIPKSMLGEGKYYVLIADGDSMIGAGIADGDWVLIRQTTKADYGKIVVALDQDNCSTLKRVCFDEDLQRPYLHPENPEYDDIYPDELSIQGVAEKVIKDV